MAAKSIYLRSALLNHVLGGPNYARPAAVYIALLTAMPTTDGGAPTECVAAGYQRATIANDTVTWNTATDGAKSNAQAVSFVTPGVSWGTIVGIAIYDAAAGGNLLYYAPLSNSILVNANEALQFPPGALIIGDR